MLLFERWREMEGPVVGGREPRVCEWRVRWGAGVEDEDASGSGLGKEWPPLLDKLDRIELNENRRIPLGFVDVAFWSIDVGTDDEQGAEERGLW